MVQQVNSEQELNNIVASWSGLVVVDAFATWCGPCRTLAPKLDEFAKKYTAVKIVKIDIDEVSSFADKYNITAMPTLLFMRMGNVVDTVEGANAPLIEKKIQQYM